MRERPKTLNEALQLAGQYQGVEESQKRLHGASAKNVSEKSFENHNVIRRVFSLWVGKEDDSESESEAVAVITNATRPSRLATQVEQLGKQIETLKLQLAATNNGRTYPRSRPNDAVSRKRSDGVVCWYCGKRGHIKRNCAKLKTSIETAAVGSCLSVDGRLGKLVVKILIDTGSAVTLVRDDVWKKVQQSPKTIKAPVHSVVAANGEKLELVGQGEEAGAVLLEPLDTFMEDHGLLVARSLSQVSCNHLVVQVLNPGPAPVVVNKDVRVGVIKPVTDSDIVCSIESTKSNRHVGHSECAHLIELMLQNTEHLSSYHKSQGVALLQEFEDVIAKSDDDLGQTSLSFHTIDTGDNQPIRQHARRLPFHQHKELSDLVDSMLSRGIIESSDSPWASPVVLVRKKDGKTRFCVDFRKLNDCTRKDAQPLPRIDESLDALGGACFFSTLDLANVDDPSHVSSFGVKTEDTSGDDDDDNTSNLSDTDPEDDDSEVVQKNLVFVIGLSPRLADAETLKKPEYFGKYGKIYKVVINNSTVYNGAQAIQAVNNAYIDGRYLKFIRPQNPTSLGDDMVVVTTVQGIIWYHEVLYLLPSSKHQLYETATLGATNTVQGEASAATLGVAMGVAMGVANTAMGVANATLTVANVTLGGANNTLVPKELKRSSSHPTTTSRESSLCESVESNGTSLEGADPALAATASCFGCDQTDQDGFSPPASPGGCGTRLEQEQPAAVAGGIQLHDNQQQLQQHWVEREAGKLDVHVCVPPGVPKAAMDTIRVMPPQNSSNQPTSVSRPQAHLHEGGPSPVNGFDPWDVSMADLLEAEASNRHPVVDVDEKQRLASVSYVTHGPTANGSHGPTANGNSKEHCHLSELVAKEKSCDPSLSLTSWQEEFRALFPNVNISFGGFGYGYNALLRSTSEGEWPDLESSQLATKWTTIENSSVRPEQGASIPPPPPGFTAKNKAAVTSSVVTSQQWPGQPTATRPGLNLQTTNAILQTNQLLQNWMRLQYPNLGTDFALAGQQLSRNPALYQQFQHLARLQHLQQVRASSSKDTPFSLQAAVQRTNSGVVMNQLQQSMHSAALN
eukprot:Em0017g621a